MTGRPSANPADPRILTIESASSSVKFAPFEAGESLRRILEGELERIGLPAAVGVLTDWSL